MERDPTPADVVAKILALRKRVALRHPPSEVRRIARLRDLAHKDHKY